MNDQTTLDILTLSFGVFGLLLALTVLGEGLRGRVERFFLDLVVFRAAMRRPL